MEKIDINELNIDDKTKKEGSYGTVYKCKFKNKSYALKKFNNIRYLNGKIKKIDEISKINCDGLVIPKYWIYENDEKIGYLTDYIKGDTMHNNKIFYAYDNKKIKILTSMKDTIENMHKHGIIHGDLHTGNYILNGNKPSIIDFDNCKYQNYDINSTQTNDFAKQFIEKYGVCEELDIFIFNLMTFALFDNTSMLLVRDEIVRQYYSVFENKEGIDICNTLFLDSDTPNKKYLIDTIK